MSEEEAKEILINLSVDKYIDERKLDIKDVEAIITLLDFYNKEKEKNRQNKMRIVQLENEITARIEDVNKEFISKDKIREKIKKYKKRKQDLLQLSDNCGRSIGLEDCDEKIAIYEELLEERN